jgi:glycosyltransferase involved in cell wall biosynthesis
VPSDAFVEVTVVLPVLNDPSRLARCLDALAAQVDAPPFEVVVVDNGSQDDTARVAHAHPLAPTVVREPRRGSYAARNAGVAVARAAVLAFTDADCLPTPTWVSSGHRASQGSPVVGGQIRPVRSAQPTVWERYDTALYLRQQDLVSQAGFAATANLWVQREAMQRVGDFNAALLSSGDFEWGQRATAAGFATTYAAEVEVLHAPRTTASQTWHLHRRLGAGWAALAEEYPQLREYRRVPLWRVIDALAADGTALRRRHVTHVHALAMAARQTGWSTRRS